MGESRQNIRYWFAGSSIILLAGILLVLLVSTIASSSALAEQRMNNANSLANMADGSSQVSPIITKPISMLNHAIPHIALPKLHAPVGFLATVNATPGHVMHGTTSGLKFCGSGVLAVVRLPITITHLAFDNTLVNGVMRPASAIPTPEINPVTTAFVAAKVSAAAAPAATISTISQATPQWPIHGAITTLFGAPDWPFQAVHTGIDISDGWRSGVTPIHPFKPGRVIDVEHSGGLGNHVIVDHGNGMTSVYGHMAFTSVQVGQFVDETAVLGTEGSTGASTGTHLHFEIRLNNSPVNPMLYIPGRP
jgi:murein DD-endopeptidase MepM/ murein hydrolase activator NlpD